MTKRFKLAVLSLLILILPAFGGWMAVRSMAIYTAVKIARHITDEAYAKYPAQDEDQKITALTREVYARFEHIDPALVPLLKIRPYISNTHYPKLLRLPRGVIETIVQKGQCDNASRMLAFILKQQGWQSIQWNMIGDDGGHTARLVTMADGKKIMVDPFFGYVALDENGRLASPEYARTRLLSGARFGTVFVALDLNADPRFYRDYKTMNMASKDEDLMIYAELPEISSPLVIGRIDGNATDVKNSGMELHITPYLNYIGHKYNRKWVRVIETPQPVTLKMTLLDEPDSGVINASPKP